MDLLKKTYYLTEMQANKLYWFSLRNKVSQSEVVRLALEKYLKEIFFKDKIETEKKVSMFKQIWSKFISNRH